MVQVGSLGGKHYWLKRCNFFDQIGSNLSKMDQTSVSQNFILILDSMSVNEIIPNYYRHFSTTIILHANFPSYTPASRKCPLSRHLPSLL